jgi:hypothetical protein
MPPIVKGFGCRPHEGRRHEFGGRRLKPFTQAVIASVSLCLSGSRSRTGLQLYESGGARIDSGSRHPQARDRALATARKDLPTGLSPDGADGEVRYVLKSISDSFPAAVQPLTVGSEVYLTRNSS